MGMLQPRRKASLTKRRASMICSLDDSRCLSPAGTSAVTGALSFRNLLLGFAKERYSSFALLAIRMRAFFSLLEARRDLCTILHTSCEAFVQLRTGMSCISVK